MSQDRRALTEFLTETLQEVVLEERKQDNLRDIVLEAFVLDELGKTPRQDVYTHVARRLKRARSNELCVQVKAAVCALPGVIESRARFKGLRPSTMPSK